MPRLLHWRGLEVWRAEVSEVELAAEGVEAIGVQLGIDPLPYRLDYRLKARTQFITESLEAEAVGEAWRRRLELRRDGEGAWHCDVDSDGDAELPAPGGRVDDLWGALDCDIGFSPLTNLMPIRRHSIHERPVSRDFTMAWVSVPDLGLHASRQRYEHLRREEGGAVVRYLDLGTHRGFEADLDVDEAGLVLHYPRLARRVGGEPA